LQNKPTAITLTQSGLKMTRAYVYIPGVSWGQCDFRYQERKLPLTKK